MSVWENTVPSTSVKYRRAEPSRRLTISDRDGSPMRPGSSADTMTPMTVARRTAAKPTETCGMAASSVWYQDAARNTSDVPIRASASATQPRFADASVFPTLCRSSCDTASATRPTTSSRISGIARWRVQRHRSHGRPRTGASVGSDSARGARSTTRGEGSGGSTMPVPS